MPERVRLAIRSVAAGFALAALFVTLLLWGDVAGPGRLVAASDRGPVALAMLWAFNGVVFSGVQFGLAVMRPGGAGGGPARGRPLPAAPSALPVPVRAASDKRVAGPQRPWGR